MKHEVTYIDCTTSQRTYKVLGIHEDEFGNRFQVIGGFHFTWFSQGIGFHADAFGWRVRVSVRFWPVMDYIKHFRYNFHFRWRGRRPPWEYLEIHLAFLRVTFGPAYGGHLA